MAKSKAAKAKKSSKRPAPSAARTQKVSAPVALSTKTRSSAPRITNGANGRIRVVRREFVGSVTNGSIVNQFSLDANSIASPGFDFNPGCSSLFPWLSNMSDHYERFRFNKLNFELISSNPTSTPGRVYLAVDYDWDDEVPTLKAQMMSNLTAIEGPMWGDLSLRCDPTQLMRDMPWKFTNTAGRVVYSEPRTAYSGFLLVGFHTSATSQMFDLWVDYDVELEAPVLEAPGATIQGNPYTFPDGPTSPYWTERSPFADYVGSTLQYVVGTWTQNQFRDRVREVIGGVGDVPALVPRTGTDRNLIPNWGRGLDIGRLGAFARMGLNGLTAVTGITPTTLINTALARMQVQVHDGYGNFLGDLIEANGTPVTGVECTDYGCHAKEGALNTAGAPVKADYEFSVGDVRRLYNSARYLVPFLTLLASVGPTAAGKAGIAYSIW